MELLDYPVRICISGSRSFHNHYIFESYLKEYLAWVGLDKKIAFISGNARRGPDALIIEWAKKHDYPVFEFDAHWDEQGKGAGFARNAEMRKYMTHLLAFWDGSSHGTEEMVDKSMEHIERYVNVSMISVKPDQEWVNRQQHKKQNAKGYNRGRKQKSGRKGAD